MTIKKDKMSLKKDKSNSIVKLAAINKIRVHNSPIDTLIKTGDFYSWGIDNQYPNFIYDLYQNSPTFHSIVEGISLYGQYSNIYNDEISKMFMSLSLYGGALLLFDGDKFITLDFRNYRRADNGWYYSSSFKSTYDRLRTKKLYLEFSEEETLYDNTNKILLISAPNFEVYPTPPIGSATDAANTEKLINRYNMASLQNGFAGNIMVNFNNGNVDDEVKTEIERNFTEKFNGVDNAGSVIFSWNDSKDCATEIQTVDIPDFADRFSILANNSRQLIFTAYRVNPNVFGLPTEGTGFAGEEYEHSFELFKSNILYPYQKLVINAYKLIGIEITFENIVLDGNK